MFPLLFRIVHRSYKIGVQKSDFVLIICWDQTDCVLCFTFDQVCAAIKFINRKLEQNQLQFAEYGSNQTAKLYTIRSLIMIGSHHIHFGTVFVASSSFRASILMRQSGLACFFLKWRKVVVVGHYTLHTMCLFALNLDIVPSPPVFFAHWDAAVSESIRAYSRLQ